MSSKERKYNRGDELLKKLIKGRITPDERTELHQLAEEDLFLMDALDGYKNKGSYVENINLIKQKISTPKTKPLNYWISRAAILLLFISGSVWIYNSFSTQTSSKVHVASIPEETPYEEGLPESLEEKYADNQVVDPIKEKEEEENQNTTYVKQNPLQLIETNTGDAPPTQKSNTVVTPAFDIPIAEEEKAFSKPESTVDQDIVKPQESFREKVEYSRAEQRVLKDTLAQSEMDNLISVLNQSTDSGLDELSTSSRVITGRLVDQSDNPLAGAIIQIQETEEGSVTNLSGDFRLEINKTNGIAEFSYTGFNSFKLPLTSLKNNQEIAMSASLALKEMQALPARQAVDTRLNKKEIHQIYPQGGLKQFQKYIEENKVYPSTAKVNNIKGAVVLSFDIIDDGSIQNIQVIQSLGFGLDAEAIRLLKEGPKWITKPKGKEVEAIYRFQF